MCDDDLGGDETDAADGRPRKAFWLCGHGQQWPGHSQSQYIHGLWRVRCACTVHSITLSPHVDDRHDIQSLHWFFGTISSQCQICFCHNKKKNNLKSRCPLAGIGGACTRHRKQYTFIAVGHRINEVISNFRWPFAWGSSLCDAKRYAFRVRQIVIVDGYYTLSNSSSLSCPLSLVVW